MTITVEDTEPVCVSYGVKQKQSPNSIMGTLLQNFGVLSSVELHIVFQKIANVYMGYFCSKCFVRIYCITG